MALTVDLTPEDEARLTEYAHQRGMAPAILARELLTASLPVSHWKDPERLSLGTESAAELMAKVGFVSGGLPDLSTNPDYMQGFGENRNMEPAGQ